MGAATLVEMEEEVRFTVGGYGTGTDQLPNTRVDRWLRWALLHVGRPGTYPHRELMTSATFALVASDPDYALASFGTSTDDVQAIRRVHNESRGRRLLPMSHRQYLDAARTGGGALVTGEPEQYAVDGANLFVYPAPTATYAGNTIRVFFYRKPVALAANPAIELAEDWDEIVIAGAIWRGFRALGIPERAELAKIEFGQLINEVVDRLAIEHVEDHDGRSFEVELHDLQEVTTR